MVIFVLCYLDGSMYGAAMMSGMIVKRDAEIIRADKVGFRGSTG